MGSRVVWVLCTAIALSGFSNCDCGGPVPLPVGPGGHTPGHGLSTVFTIVLENHDYAEIVGSPNAPYINSLIGRYGLATNYSDSGTHPSLPNYLYMISGATQYPGVLDVNPDWPGFPSDSDNLGRQLTLAGVSWRSYQESMGAPCSLDGNGNYAPKHDPFLYFSFIQNDKTLCQKTNVDYTHFAADLQSREYQYMWITPNLLDDGHDPTTDPVTGLKQADAWLASEVPKILASDAYKEGGALFITWDEAEGRNGDASDQVPMIVVSEKLVAPGFRTKHAYSHASYLATIEDLFALPRIGAAASAQNLLEFFE